MGTQTVGGPGHGWFPADEIVYSCRAGEALSEGDQVAFDFLGSNTTTNQPGDIASKFSNVRYTDSGAVTTAGINGGVFGIAMEAIANDAQGKVLLRGIYLTANVEAACAEGDLLTVAEDGRLNIATGSTGDVIVAIALDDDVSNVAPVLFNGWGFGQDVATAAAS